MSATLDLILFPIRFTKSFLIIVGLLLSIVAVQFFFLNRPDPRACASMAYHASQAQDPMAAGVTVVRAMQCAGMRIPPTDWVELIDPINRIGGNAAGQSISKRLFPGMRENPGLARIVKEGPSAVDDTVWISSRRPANTNLKIVSIVNKDSIYLQAYDKDILVAEGQGLFVSTDQNQLVWIFMTENHFPDQYPGLGVSMWQIHDSLLQWRANTYGETILRVGVLATQESKAAYSIIDAYGVSDTGKAFLTNMGYKFTHPYQGERIISPMAP